MDQQEIAWTAGPEDLARSRTVEFMPLHGIESYSNLVERSITDIEWFWSEAVDYLGIPFSTPYTTILDSSDGLPHARWFDGGTINLSEESVTVDIHPGNRASAIPPRHMARLRSAERTGRSSQQECDS